MSHTLLIDYLHDELHSEQLQAAASQVIDSLKDGKTNISGNDVSNYTVAQYSVNIEDEQGNFITSEATEDRLNWLKQSKPSGIFHIPDNGYSVLGYSETIDINGNQTTVTVIEKKSYTPNTLDKLHVLIWGISVTIFIVISIIVYFGVAIALKPIKTMSSQLTALKQGSRKRLDESVPEEFSGLVKHLNRLLESYDKKLTWSRHLAANISHSLKTPLAVIHSIIGNDVIPDRINNQLKCQLSKMHELIDTQMRKTEMSGQYIGKPTPVIEKTLALIDVVSRIYPAKHIHLEETLPRELAWPVDERDFNEIVGNLLDNAGKWSTEDVHCQLRIEGQSLIILISDDGPGVEPSQLTELTKRQKRLDERMPGYGLGLSIVAEIVHDYGGVIELSTSSKGGLSVLVELPKTA